MRKLALPSEMTPITILKETDVVEKWWETPITGERYQFPLWYGIYVDLTNKQYLIPKDKYKDNGKVYPYPTLNDCVEKGLLIEKKIYEEHYLMIGSGLRSLTKRTLNKIKKFFKEKGYNVTDEAIGYLWDSWIGDLKSGYRDEENGYHLFCPCGCNPFSITLTSLPKEMKLDWQKTYYC